MSQAVRLETELLMGRLKQVDGTLIPKSPPQKSIQDFFDGYWLTTAKRNLRRRWARLVMVAWQIVNLLSTVASTTISSSRRLTCVPNMQTYVAMQLFYLASQISKLSLDVKW